MPKPRSLSPDQELAAYAKFKAAKNARGIVSILARQYFVTRPGMLGILQRVERETKVKDSRESFTSMDAHE